MKKKMKKMSRKRWIVLGIFVAVCILVILLMIRSKKKKLEMSETGNILSVEVTKGTIQSGVSGTGTLAYSDTMAICVMEDLEIDEVFVSEGSNVSQGMLLATVDETSLAACLSKVEEEISDVDSTISTEKSKAESTKITAGVAGRVKKIYAEKDAAVTQLMKENGALMLISTDGYMALDLENAKDLNAGDKVRVTDGREAVDGTVSSVEDGVAEILFTDSKYDANANLTVTDMEEKEIGKAEAYVHAPLEVVGTNGTVAAVKVSEGDSVQASTTVITLEETSQTVEYQQAVKEREELVELLNTLISIRTEGGIKAQADGVVESVNTDGSFAESSDSSQENLLSDVSGYVVAKEQSVVNSGTKKTDERISGITTMSSASVAVQGRKAEAASREAFSGTKTEETSEKTELEPPTGLSGGEGAIMGTTTSMEYAADENAVEWKTCTDQATEVEAGTWYIRYKETDMNAASAAVKIEISEKNENASTGKNTQNKQTGSNGESTTDDKNTYDTKDSASQQRVSSVKTNGSSASTGSADSTSEDSSAISTVELFTIAGGETMTVTMTVDELDILSMKEGLEAAISVDAVEDKTFTGSITGVSGSTSGSGGVAQYSVEVTFEKTEELLEGMSASVEVILEKAEDVLVVPISAITDRGRSSIVYTQNSQDSLNGEVEIETGLSDETYVEIVSGLSEGDTIYYRMAGSEDSSGGNLQGGFGDMPGGGMPGEDFNGSGFDGKRPERLERKEMPDSSGGINGNRQ